MAESVLAHDRLVVLDRKAGDVGDQLGSLGQHGGVDVGGEGHDVLAHFQRHHDLFQRGIAGAFADAVDGAFHLARACQHTGQRIGDRQSQIVMAMGGEGHFIRVGYAVAQHGDDFEIFLRRGVAHRVGNIDGGGAGMDRHFHAAAEEIRHRAGGIFRRPLHV